jgi:hypothetical protein
MKTFLFGLLAFGAGYALATYLHQGKSNESPTKSSPRPVNSSQPQSQKLSEISTAAQTKPGKEWFETQMKAFGNSMFAYYISQFALEKNLPAAKTMELYQKYGRAPLLPTIQEYEAGFREQKLTLETLTEVALEWMKINGIEGNANNWEQKISNYIENSKKTAALKVVQECCNA